MAEQDQPHFDSDQHAWEAGMLIGLLMRQGVSVRPGDDGQGNYTPELTINVPLDDSGAFRPVTIHVLPPPV